MVRMADPKIGSMNRTVSVEGFSDYANPNRTRLLFYSINMGMPERDGEEPILQLTREVELVMERDVFLKFAERIGALKKWVEENHPGKNLDKEEVKKYLQETYTAEEIKALWMGHEIKPSEGVIPIGLIGLEREQ